MPLCRDVVDRLRQLVHEPPQRPNGTIQCWTIPVWTILLMLLSASVKWLEEQGSPSGVARRVILRALEMARRAGVPSGVARRVILRALEISSVLEFRKSGIFNQCDNIF